MYYEMLDVYSVYLPLKKYQKSSFMAYCYDYYNNEHWIEPNSDWFVFRNVSQTYYFDVIDLTRLYFSYLYRLHGDKFKPKVIKIFKTRLYNNLKSDPQIIKDIKKIKSELDVIKGEFKPCATHLTSP